MKNIYKDTRPVVWVFLALSLVACDEDESTNNTVEPGDASIAEDSSSTDTNMGNTSPGADLDASEDGDMEEGCATDTPCVADTDCIALAGTRCNTALTNPVCHQVLCAAEGEPCSDTALCQMGLSCSSSMQCADLDCEPGTGPTLGVDRELLTFPAPPAQGESSVSTLTLQNNGAETLTIDALALQPDNGTFTLTGSTPTVGDLTRPMVTLECGETWVVELTYTQLGIGTELGLLRIDSNDTTQSPRTIELQGGSGSACLTVQPSRLTFEAALGQPATQSLALINCGTETAVSVLGIRVAEPNQDIFSLADNTQQLLSQPIGIGEAVSLDVTFMTQMEGVFSGELVVESNDALQSEQRIPLQGQTTP